MRKPKELTKIMKKALAKAQKDCPQCGRKTTKGETVIRQSLGKSPVDMHLFCGRKWLRGQLAELRENLL